MIILLLILALICVYRIQFSGHHKDYIHKHSTDSIKGVFTIIILYSHLKSYLPMSCMDDPSGKLFFGVINSIGQLMVVMFLFYSGYGILESYKNKESYLENFFGHRILKTLLNFDIAVLLYLVIAIIYEKDYTIKEYVLSFTAWESIGNSNWFVFDIIILYIITLIGLKLHKRNNYNLNYFLILIYGLSFGLIVILYFTKHSYWWYDTVLSFPTGMLYSSYKSQIERLLSSNKYYWLISSAVFALFCVLYLFGGRIGSVINSVIFPLIVVFLTYKVRLNNSVLRWLGINCFAIYILQRIPMIVFSELGYNNDWILFSIAVIPSTLLLAALFTLMTGRVNKLIFR